MPLFAESIKSWWYIHKKAKRKKVMHIYITMTSWNGKKNSTLPALCAGNSLVIGEFPSQRPVTRSFDAYFDLPD